MLATRMLYRTPNPTGIYVPLGAEGYNANGNVVIPVFEEGWLYGTQGQVVFKGNPTGRDFDTVLHNLKEAEVLLVAPGGGGGGGSSSSNRGAGGGGAGGVLYTSAYTVPSSLEVKIEGVGAGGAPGNHGVTGGICKFGALEAYGGGFGSRGIAGSAAQDAGDGGSGGGGGDHMSGTSNGGTGVTGQGHDGADRVSSGGAGGGGSGGGGAGTAGIQSTGYIGGAGGDPAMYFGFPYAKGGRGGDFNAIGDSGVAGRPHTGDGGGGGRRGDSGKDGGYGLIIVRWGGYNKKYVHLYGGNATVSGSASDGGVCIAALAFPAVNASGMTKSNGRLIIDMMCDNPMDN